mgnify:CR=1 FL=1
MAKTLTAGKAAGARTKQDKRAYAQLGHNTWRKAFMQHYWLYILMIPGILYMLIFNYTPMAGLVMAFEDFSPYNGDTAIQALFGSPFAGLKYFEKLFTGPDFWRLLRNTLAISLANLIFAFPAPIILALLLNELRCKWFKRFSQTLVYIPHFVSIVIVAALTYQLFSTTDGVAYHMLVQVFGKQNAPDIMSDPKLFSTMIVGQNLWKETGYGTIIYLAALSSVDTQLYEAAKIDGASDHEILFKIKLPMVMPSITICTFLTLTNSFKLFDQNVALTAGEPANASEMLALNIYNTFYGRSGAQWKGIGQAKAAVFFLIVVIISLIQLKFTRSKEVQQ